MALHVKVCTSIIFLNFMNNNGFYAYQHLIHMYFLNFSIKKAVGQIVHRTENLPD